jgi:long-chain acyl-CoA synthetase
MPNLWELAKPRQPAPSRRRARRHAAAAVFWNAAEGARRQVWMREKKLGIWREWTWNQTAAGGARDRTA